jgi:hypothetical protein
MSGFIYKLFFLCCLLSLGRRGVGACGNDVENLPPQPNDENSLHVFLSKLSDYAEECLPEDVRLEPGATQLQLGA